MSDLLAHHYRHLNGAVSASCINCLVEKLFVVADINEEKARYFLGELDGLGIIFAEKVRGDWKERCQVCKEIVTEGQRMHHSKYCLGAG